MGRPWCGASYLPFDFCDYLTGGAGFTVLAFFGGLLCGWILLLPYPSSSIRLPGLRIAALIVSPVLAGFICYVVGELRAGLGHANQSRKHFGYDFTFTLALALVASPMRTTRAGDPMIQPRLFGGGTCAPSLAARAPFVHFH